MNIQDVYTLAEERLIFMKGLALLAMADGCVDEQEQAFILNAAIGFGLEHAIDELKCILNDSGTVANVVIFNNRLQALLFIREAIQLSYVDGDYSDSERCVINSIAELNLIEKHEVAQLDNWVGQGIAWKKRGDDLIRELEVA